MARNQRLVGTQARLSSSRKFARYSISERGIRLSSVYRDPGGGERGRKSKEMQVGGGGEHSVHVIVSQPRNFIGGTLSLCIFMRRVLPLPAFRHTRAQSRAHV